MRAQRERFARSRPDDQGEVVTAVLRSGAVTSIGSLPHRDADTAAAFVVRHHAALPAAPQLPRRSRFEGMVVQAARGIAGVHLDSQANLSIDVDALDVNATVQPTFDSSSHAGLLAFLSLVAGREEPIKLQLTGPITLGIALADAGAPAELAFAVAAAAVRAEGRALVE